MRGMGVRRPAARTPTTPQRQVSARCRGRRPSQAMADGILIADPDGQIVFANAQLAALSGYDAEQLEGMAVETLVPQRYRQAHRGHRAAFAAEARTRPIGSGLEIVRCRRDGDELPVDIALRPGPRDRPGQVVAAVRDASERKQLEQALWHSQQRLRLPVDAVADYAIFMLDPQGRVVSWNEGAEGSRAGDRMRFWASVYRGSTRPRRWPPGRRPGRWRWPAATAGSRTRAGGCARTAPGSGRMWSSPPSTTTPEPCRGAKVNPGEI